MKHLFSLITLFFAVQMTHAISVSVQTEFVTCANPMSGAAYASVSGGTPPYSYLWSTGSTDQSLSGLGVGSYSVTVTDSFGETATGSDQVYMYEPQVGIFGVPGCDPGSVRLLTSAGMLGPDPYTLDGGNCDAGLLTGSEPYQRAIYMDCFSTSPGTQFNLSMTDGDGCPANVTGTMPGPSAAPVPQVLSVEGACSSGSNGKVVLHVPTSGNNWKYDLYLSWNSQPAWPLDQIFGVTALNHEINSLPAGTYGMIMRYHWEDPYVWLGEQIFLDDFCQDTTWFTIPDLGYTCGTISGTVFMDDDLNCLGPDWRRLPQQLLLISPGGYYTMSNQQGFYQANLPYGSYTIEHLSTEFEEHCVGGPQAFDISTASTTALRNFADTATTVRDVSISASQGAARPGFQTSIALNVRNLNWGSTGQITVSLVFDPLLEYLSAQPNPLNVTGNTITWNLTQLNSFQDRQLSVAFQVPPDVGLIGTEIFHSATVGIAQAEDNLSNNSFSLQRTITGAYDPNDKLAYTSGGNRAIWQINEDEWVDYTIRFQNTGNDTAFNVLITDTLPASLDPGSIEMGASSHSFIWELRDQGTLNIRFINIQLPDSNVNEAASHGFVGFRIKPVQPVLPGSTIENIANIYFDFNPPVITEPCVLVVEFSTGIAGSTMPTGLRLSPVPVSDVLHFTSEQELTGIQVLAADGRLVLSTLVHGLSGSILISELKAGTYLIVATRRDGSPTRQRFVKQ